jgi:hypothetical protein
MDLAKLIHPPSNPLVVVSWYQWTLPALLHPKVTEGINMS